MKTILYLAAGAAAFSFGAKKGAKSAPKPSGGRQVAKGGQTASTIVVPDTLKPFAGFGNPTIVAQRAAEREAKKAETLSKLIPTSVAQRRTWASGCRRRVATSRSDAGRAASSSRSAGRTCLRRAARSAAPSGSGARSS